MNRSNYWLSKWLWVLALALLLTLVNLATGQKPPSKLPQPTQQSP